MVDETQTTLGSSLRDQLTEAFDKQVEQPVKVEKTETVKEISLSETPEQKEQRSRDEHGRFASKDVKEVKPDKDIKAEIQPNAVIETKPRPQRPSSWKKEMWDHWEKLDPSVAEYLNQREQDFAKGVSTYKQEWESAKPLLDAMAQFKPILDQHGIKPTEWISNLGNAHKLLAMGSPEQKLSMFVKLAQDYQVPLQSMFSQGQDGKVYFNPQIQAYQPPQVNQPDPRLMVREVLEEERANQEVQSFVSNTKDYPYFEQVKDTMAGLLQAGLAPDLKSAYESAIRLPAHSEIFNSLQQQQRDKEEQEKREQTQRLTQGARAKAVSPKTSTPVGTSVKGERKGLRGTLEDAFEEHTNARV